MKTGAEMYSDRRLAGVRCGKFQETAVTGISFWIWIEIVFRIP